MKLRSIIINFQNLSSGNLSQIYISAQSVINCCFSLIPILFFQDVKFILVFANQFSLVEYPIQKHSQNIHHHKCAEKVWPSRLRVDERIICTSALRKMKDHFSQIHKARFLLGGVGVVELFDDWLCLRVFTRPDPRFSINRIWLKVCPTYNKNT